MSGKMEPFEWFVFINDAPLPIAGFYWRDQAEKWGRENYPRDYKIKPAGVEAETLNAGVEAMKNER